MWVLGNEIVMPAFGLTKKVRNYSLMMQANALSEHLIYAYTVSRVHRGLVVSLTKQQQTRAYEAFVGGAGLLDGLVGMWNYVRGSKPLERQPLYSNACSAHDMRIR